MQIYSFFKENHQTSRFNRDCLTLVPKAEIDTNGEYTKLSGEKRLSLEICLRKRLSVFLYKISVLISTNLYKTIISTK